MADPSIVRFRGAVAAACAELESRRQEVNDLNVFPVADGDTGDNMAMTMRSVLDELDRLNGQPIDDIGRDELVHAVARAALLGARGNSGVILSQIVRGVAEELVSRPGEAVDPVLVAAGFARAAEAAYASVREPAEGTMLSAVRAMAVGVTHEIAHMEPARLDPDVAPVEQDALLAKVLESALEAGKESVRRGPEQLQALREAGVVDAGAYGLIVILAGVVAALRGDTEPTLEHQPAPSRSLHLPQHESSRFRYCTNFVVTGERLDRHTFSGQLERLGDCVLVVGDEKTLRVHLHTDTPDDAVALFEPFGEVSRFDVCDMTDQIAERSTRLGGLENGKQARSTAVAIASGPGVVRMYEQLGAVVVRGAETLNPSTYELLAAIHDAPAEEVVVVPNSANVVMAAERAAELSERSVEVVSIHAQQAGLAALLAFDPHRSARENADALVAAVAGLRTGGIAQAARDDPQGRFRSGDALGYVEGELVAFGDLARTLEATLADLVDGAELVTAIAGEGAPLRQPDIQNLLPPAVDLDYHEGAQPAWWWLLSAE